MCSVDARITATTLAAIPDRTTPSARDRLVEAKFAPLAPEVDAPEVRQEATTRRSSTSKHGAIFWPPDVTCLDASFCA